MEKGILIQYIIMGFIVVGLIFYLIRKSIATKNRIKKGGACGGCSLKDSCVSYRPLKEKQQVEITCDECNKKSNEENSNLNKH